MPDDPREALIARIETIRNRWRTLVADVGEERMEQPGAMGDWTFKDVASHLTVWRRRTVDRLEAAGRGEPSPAPRWPASLGETEDHASNAWIHDETKALPVADVLADTERTYDDFIAAIRAIPIEAATDPDRFDWLEGVALVDSDFGGHLNEHEPDVRRWLGRSTGPS